MEIIKKAIIKWSDKRKWLTSTLSTNPLETMYQPINPWKHIRMKIKCNLKQYDMNGKKIFYKKC